jgi:hypothetical protein
MAGDTAGEGDHMEKPPTKTLKPERTPRAKLTPTAAPTVRPMEVD